MHFTRLIAAAAAGTALIGTLGSAPAAADPTPITSTGLVRIAGSDRYSTAVKVSQKSFTKPQSTVVIASGESWADALAAGPLAAFVEGPILLVKKDSLPAVVDAELKRLGPTHVIVVGGRGAISDYVYGRVGFWANDTIRIAGADRYATAEAVAAQLPPVDSVYVASGTGFADSLAGGAAAAAEGGALMLTSPSSLSPAAARVLTKNTPSHVVILGGTAAVSSGVEAQIKAAAPGATVDRAAGRDRYETAAVVADALWGDTGADAVFYASGTNFPDALAAAPAAYVNDAPVLLTRGTCTPGATAAVEESLAPSLGVFLGGTTVTYSGSKVC